MAIKFSQFVVKTNSSDLSHIVGYNGVDNIQITPTNFLNSALTGTAGQVLFYDTTGVTGDNGFFWDNTNKRLGIGTTSPARKFAVSNAGASGIEIEPNYVTGVNEILSFNRSSSVYEVMRLNGGSFEFQINGSEQMRITSGANVGIGTPTPSQKLEVSGNIKVGDSQLFIAGNSSDLQIYHNATDSVIENVTGDLYITNKADDKDIVFRSDNGSGGFTTYFYLDGSNERLQVDAPNGMLFSDNIPAKFGASSDLNIKHDGSNSKLENYTGHLNIIQEAVDKDIVFFCDDGSSGSVAEYFRVDGGENRIVYSIDGRHLDGIKSMYGGGADLQIYHDGSNSYIRNTNTNLIIKNDYNDGDIIFESDDGSGNIAEYFRLDGGATITVVSKEFRFADSVPLKFGNLPDVEIIHNGTNTLISNETGDLYITNAQDDGDILFRCDDGSGSVTEYFRLDGGGVLTRFSQRLRMDDNKSLEAGSSGDLQIKHDGANSEVSNLTGNLNIKSTSTDGDISFFADNSSGGVTEYFRVDGGDELTLFSKNVKLSDSVELRLGNSNDLVIKHNATNSVIDNITGNLVIQNQTNDADIEFKCDDGGGGLATYFQLDGSEVRCLFSVNAEFGDNVKAKFGTSDDLQIYHDGSDSYIKETGTGNLFIQAAANVQIESSTSGENMAVFNENGAVELYYDNSKKFETTSTGIKVTGVSEYSDNTAAIAAGLTTGDVYRTGDLLKIVH